MPAPAIAYPPPRLHRELAETVATATALVVEAARAPSISLEEVARWCAEVGGVDPRLERAALRHATAVVLLDFIAADVIASLRARLVAAGELLPGLVARGGVPRVLAMLGLDDVDPPAGALVRALQPRIARFYWQRLRAYIAWSAACQWPI